MLTDTGQQLLRSEEWLFPDFGQSCGELAACRKPRGERVRADRGRTGWRNSQPVDSNGDAVTAHKTKRRRAPRRFSTQLACALSIAAWAKGLKAVALGPDDRLGSTPVAAFGLDRVERDIGTRRRRCNPRAP